MAHYIAPGAPRELNLSHRDRTAVLHALQHTTHPSAFNSALTVVEGTLRGQLHPNFVRWSICNGNKPKIFFVKLMGISHTLAGIIVGVLLNLSNVSRWWCLLQAPVTLIGIFTLVAAYKGLCVILHGSGKTRNLKPWEEVDSIYSDTEASIDKSFRDDDTTTLAASDAASVQKSTRKSPSTTSFETFGSNNGSYKDDAWFNRYEKKPFETSVWVQEDAVRIIQDRIIVQSQVWGLILTTLFTIAFVATPRGDFY